MFGFFSKKRVEKLETDTKSGFDKVRKDMDSVGKWIKHLDKQDKQLFDSINLLRNDLSTIREEIESMREGIEMAVEWKKNKQVFKKLPVLDKQMAVEHVQEAVQTPVQTGNFYEILKGMSANERVLIITLANSDMKLSYEDLAMLLGKERSTIRGQINSIKQKSEGLVMEIIEKNGKKRVYVPEEIKEKLAKYAKVRGKKKK